MAYRWHYTSSGGTEDITVPEAGATFEEQAEAEDWLGANWAGLLAGGVDAVTLVDGTGEPVYGPMSLHPPEEPAD